MKKMLFPITLLVFLSSACEKESLRPEANQVPGVKEEQLQASPEKLGEVKINEAALLKEGAVKFTNKNNKPAAGIPETDWKVDYLGDTNIEEMSRAHTLLVEYIIDLQDFLEAYPVEQYYFLNVHKEPITKLQLSLALKTNLEVGIEKLNNAELERARYEIVQRAFEDMDRELEERGMTFKKTEDSLEPVVDVSSKKEAKRLARHLKQYIRDGEEILSEANVEYSLLEAGKIEIAKGVLKEIEERLN